MRWWQLGAVMVLAALGLAVYWPGLAGGFVFDDYVNLNALGRYGSVRDLDGMLRYLSSGVADATGRPVAMLSFLLDAHTWPADPAPFKWHSLLLHIANGLLLGALLQRLGRLLPLTPRDALFAAWTAALTWTLHPLWVSTTLYVVQRHAMLAAFFVLLGLHTWLQARACAACGQWGRARLWAMLALPLCLLLAALSKPNGALLPVLLVVLEWTLLAHLPLPVRMRQWRRWLVYLPAALVLLALLGYGLLFTADAYAGRDFTLAQRLLTQPRALFAYVYDLVRPNLHSGSVFADGYRASHGWLQPLTTLPSLVLLVLSTGLAVWGRRRWPVACAAWLFFVAGHLVESTVLPLELYFEHRNYLPSVLFFWLLPLALMRLPLAAWLQKAVLLLVISLLALISHQQARLWGQPLALATYWAGSRPDSARAQAHWAGLALADGQAAAVEQRLAPLLTVRPEELQLSLNLLDAQCRLGRVPPQTVQVVATGLQQVGPGDALAHRWLSGLLLPATGTPCAGLPDELRQGLLQAVLAGPQDTPLAQARAAGLRTRQALSLGQCGQAAAQADAQLRALPRPEPLLESTLLLATHCPAGTALQQLRRSRAVLEAGLASPGTGMPQLRDWLMARQGYWPGVFGELETRLARDAAAEPGCAGIDGTACVELQQRGR